jgi:hypothetical protein
MSSGGGNSAGRFFIFGFFGKYWKTCNISARMLLIGVENKNYPGGVTYENISYHKKDRILDPFPESYIQHQRMREEKAAVSGTLYDCSFPL